MLPGLWPEGWRRPNSGFSLIEIVLAVGVVSFALLAVVGTVPIGLDTVRNSMVQAATANITQQLRGELQQISFKPDDPKNPNGPSPVSRLGDKNYYYTQEGMVIRDDQGKVLDAAADEEEAKKLGAYYKAVLQVSGEPIAERASVAGATSQDNATFQPANARVIKVTLSYPLIAPAANRKSTVFSLFSAKQKAS